MMPFRTMTLAVALVVFSMPASSAEPKTFSASELDQAVQIVMRLNAKDAKECDRAERLLVEMGPSVLPLLKLAVAMSSDSQVQARGLRVMKSLGGKLESEGVRVRSGAKDVNVGADGVHIKAGPEGTQATGLNGGSRNIEAGKRVRVDPREAAEPALREEPREKEEKDQKDGKTSDKVRVGVGGVDVDVDLDNDD